MGHRNDCAHCQALLWTQLLSRPTVFFDCSVMRHEDGWLDHGYYVLWKLLRHSCWFQKQKEARQPKSIRENIKNR